MKNLLIQADNIDGLRYLLEKKNLRGRIDLVYIDPPFATNGNFTVTAGRASTISNSNRGELAYTDKILGKDFIEFLRERLLIIRELLSGRGSIYLHTDYKIGHYVRVMMDEVFGIANFRNDITRVKCNPKNFKRIGYGNIKDMIVKTSSNPDSIVLDCFCGSGTTLLAAARNGRRWIGIDCSDVAINATKRRMKMDEDGLPRNDVEFTSLYNHDRRNARKLSIASQL